MKNKNLLSFVLVLFLLSINFNSFAQEECAQVAPTLTIEETDCDGGGTGAPYTLADNGDGMAGANDLTEYIITGARHISHLCK